MTSVGDSVVRLRVPRISLVLWPQQLGEWPLFLSCTNSGAELKTFSFLHSMAAVSPQDL